jgi:hypothetical protein
LLRAAVIKAEIIYLRQNTNRLVDALMRNASQKLPYKAGK